MSNAGLQILTHIRCHTDDARIAVKTGVDGVYVTLVPVVKLIAWD